MSDEVSESRRRAERISKLLQKVEDFKKAYPERDSEYK